MAAPKTPKNRWSDKAWRDAIRVAVMRNAEDGGKKLAKLADTLVSAGLAGDVTALKEIGDRLDGKPNQTQDVVVTQRMVVEAPMPAKDADSWASEHGPH